MSKNPQHIAGPWELFKKAGDYPDEIGLEIYHVDREPYLLIASLTDDKKMNQDRKHPLPEGTAEATHRLIVEAPVMYKVIKAMHHAFNCPYTWCSEKLSMPVLDEKVTQIVKRVEDRQDGEENDLSIHYGS